MPRCTAAIICSAAGGGYAAPHGCQGGGRGHAEDAAVVDAKVTDQERLCVCVFFFFLAGHASVRQRGIFTNRDVVTMKSLGKTSKCDIVSCHKNKLQKLNNLDLTPLYRYSTKCAWYTELRVVPLVRQK